MDAVTQMVKMMVEPTQLAVAMALQMVAVTQMVIVMVSMKELMMV